MSATNGNGKVHRFTAKSPCPICKGHDGARRGQGERCHGYLSGDGGYAHCSREEHAGTLPVEPKSLTYAHRLKGSCKCGEEHNPAEIPDRRPRPNGKAKDLRGAVESTYDYRDVDGMLLFQVVRYKSKAFVQRRPTAKGGWIWNLDGIDPVPYRLPELVAADPAATVYIAEGEKDCNQLWLLGMPATCNPGGAGKWKDEFSPYLAGRHVVIIPDHDKAGSDHAAAVARSVRPHAASVKVIDLAEACRTLGLGELPEKGDASDFLEMGGSAEDLDLIEGQTAEWAEAEADDQEPEPKKEEKPSRFILDAIDVADLVKMTFPREWIVKGISVLNEPMITGGDRKTLKTSTKLDYAISVALGIPFLGRFEVPRPRRVLFLSGESGKRTIQETIIRICAAKGIDPEDLRGRFHVGFNLPRLSVPDDLAVLTEFIRGQRLNDRGIELVIIDPLYLCLLSGGSKLDAANLFDVGPLLKTISDVCLDAGSTPDLIHHLRKARADRFAPPELEDLAFAGVQEFARQWILMGRREVYEPGSGDHKLWLSVGGSAGHSGLWATDINEGAITEDFGGREWRVYIASPTQVRAEAKETTASRKAEEAAEKERQRERDKTKRFEADVKIAFEVLGRIGKSTEKTWRDDPDLRWDGARIGPVARFLEKQGQIRRCKVKVNCGNGTRDNEGWEPCNANPIDPQILFFPHRETPGDTGRNGIPPDASRCD